jgi:tRNA threonylcarbamoyladenosine biosynthesis protein TsaB
MSKILSIDSSTTGCSVAVFEESNLLAASEIRIERSSAENFTLLIDQVLKNANLGFSDIAAVAVAKGPGSYTGLRIAVSTAKGLCFALDKPLISYETLKNLAVQADGSFYHLICPMIDARRMEVYCKVYEANSLEVKLDTSALILDEHSFKDLLEDHKILFIGEGSFKFKEVLLHPNAYFLNKEILPLAAASGELVYDKFKRGDFEDLVSFEPFYLKEYLFKTKKKP